MILSVCAFLFLCWLVVGALLGVWDDTCVVVPVYRLLRAAGGLLFGGLLCGVWVLCENWIVDASNLFFLYFVWFILAPSRMRCFVCVVG